MPSTFDTLMDELGSPVLLEYVGEPLTYTPAGGAGVACTGIVGFEEDEEEETLDGRRRKRVRDVSLSTDDVAAPALNATVTIGGVEYAIERVVSKSATFTRLALRRLSALEVTVGKYRG